MKSVFMLRRFGLVCVATTLACSGGQPVQRLPGDSGHATATPGASSSTALAAPAAAKRAVNPEAGGTSQTQEAALAAYQQSMKEASELGFAALLERLRAKPAGPANLGFAPSSAKFYREVTSGFELTRPEKAVLERQGFVQLERKPRASMGRIYLDIYERDLPVLITTDSILDALHRTYDHALEQLEKAAFRPVLLQVLSDAHMGLAGLEAGSPDEHTARCDIDLYLSVARELLLEGASPPPDLPDLVRVQEVDSVCAQQDRVAKLLALVASEQLQTPDRPCTPLYGGERCIDFSQFRPRGHYAGDRGLSAYFRAMMWLGREDTGFRLTEAGQGGVGAARHPADPVREGRDAALLSLLFEQTGGVTRLERLSKAIDGLVGQGEFLGLSAVQAVLIREKIASLADAVAKGAELPRLLQQDAPKRAVRSQMTAGTGRAPAPYDATFQLFGQRSLIDSLVLSHVVYDSTRMDRMLPSGLDVMAALGDDEAVYLLESDLNRWQYGANLLAVRRATEAFFSAAPAASFHHQWLSALSLLQKPEADAQHFPKTMRSEAWERKMLETKLSAWAQMRRDNILYAAQSYTGFILCEYPKGTVEPYPEFYRALAHTIEELSTTLADFAGVPAEQQAESTLLRQATHTALQLRRSIEPMVPILNHLAELANKELLAQPFTAQDEEFVKNTIQKQVSGGGCGAPRVAYTGWYPQLLLGGGVDEFQPVVADVHTSQAGFLEEGIGAAQPLVIAIDNEQDRTTYVGPTYTHYEFTAAQRMTDQEWAKQIESGKLPKRPAYTEIYRAPLPKAEAGGARERR